MGLVLAAALMTGCGASIAPSEPGPISTPTANDISAASADPCLVAVRRVSTFTSQLAGALVPLRPLIVATSFDAYDTLVATRHVSEIVASGGELSSRVGGCESALALVAPVEHLLEQASEALENALAATDANAQRDAVVRLFGLLPDVLAISQNAKSTGDSLAIDVAAATVPTGADRPVGSLPPLPTARPGSTPAASSAQGNNPGPTPNTLDAVRVEHSSTQAGYAITSTKAITQVVAKIPDIPGYACEAAVPDLSDFAVLILYTSTGHAIYAYNTSQCYLGHWIGGEGIRVDRNPDEVSFPAHGTITASISGRTISWSANGTVKKTSFAGSIIGAYAGYTSGNGVVGPFGKLAFSGISVTTSGGTTGLRAAWLSTTRYDIPVGVVTSYGTGTASTSVLGTGNHSFSLTRKFSGP